MPSSELAALKRKDIVEQCAKEGYCQRIAMLFKEKEEREAENEKLREIFSFAAGKFEQKEKEISSLRNQLQIANQKIKELTEEIETKMSNADKRVG